MKPAIFLDHIYDAARCDHLSLDSVLTRVRLLGYVGLEVMFDPEADAYALANRFYHAGLSVSGLYVLTDFANHPEDLSAARMALDHCFAMSTPRLLVVPGKIDLNDSGRAQIQRENMIAALTRLCAEAKTRGITVTIEDFGSAAAPYRNAAGLRYFMDRVPDLKFTYDTGNFAFSDEDELAAFELLKDRIAHVHLKDFALEPYAPGQQVFTSISGRPLYGVPFGQGFIHSEEILRRLREIGYDGMLAVEHHAATNPLHYIEQSAKWLIPRVI